MPVPYIDLVQGSDEWLEARKGLLNASTAAAAAGMRGAYSSRAECWRQYMGQKMKVNSHMVFGSEHEEDARHDGEIAISALSFPTGLFIHREHDWLGASPDGEFLQLGLHEIKCRNSEPYSAISPQHMAQIQVQLACADYDQCIFQSWTPIRQRIWLVPRSAGYWKWLLPLLEEFWQYVINQQPPPTVRPRRIAPIDIQSEIVYEG
ncbi:MAG: hypothetical protein CL394_05500 [Acidiferrobacteraceae bacterium]|nr:hypothetical protein [Acidiferrobacteraceae bacterium]